MFIINLPTSLSPQSHYRNYLSIQFSLSRTPTPPKPKLSPLHVNLYLKPFAEINLAEQPLQHYSWTQHISIRLQPTVSKTPLALPLIVPVHSMIHIIYIFYISYIDSLDRPTSFWLVIIIK